MQYSADEIQVALRVLYAVTFRRIPDPDDVQNLRAFAAADFGDINVDELPGEFVQQALDRREKTPEEVSS